MNTMVNKKIKWLVVVSGLMVITGCATTVKPSYVSPTQYQSFSCVQLLSEFSRIQQYIDNGVQTPKRTGVGVGVGLGGGWGSRGWGIGPSVSVNMGQSSNTKSTELSKLYGEQDAISQAASFKNCSFIPKRKSN